MAALALVCFVLAVLLARVAFRTWDLRRRALARTAAEDERGESEPGPGDAMRPPLDNWLRRRLLLAGFKGANAPLLFVMWSVAAVLVGAVAAWVVSVVAVPWMADAVREIPGGVGDMLVAVIRIGPWIVLSWIALAPLLVLRAARRRRVRVAERDLPITLELLATLVQAGLSFDAALSKILGVQRRPARPLASEFRVFQRDTLAGIPRLQALHHLAQRLDVTAVTIFVAAVIQTEQVGASIAETLRHQADDLRSRRREHALLLAQSLPVKLVFPLVVCFLPGIFLSTLGPVLYQMIEVANGVLRPVAR
jgi:Flp pilus assembly protein TadB